MGGGGVLVEDILQLSISWFQNALLSISLSEKCSFEKQLLFT